MPAGSNAWSKSKNGLDPKENWLYASFVRWERQLQRNFGHGSMGSWAVFHLQCAEKGANCDPVSNFLARPGLLAKIGADANVRIGRLTE